MSEVGWKPSQKRILESSKWSGVPGSVESSKMKLE